MAFRFVVNGRRMIGVVVQAAVGDDQQAVALRAQPRDDMLDQWPSVQWQQALVGAADTRTRAAGKHYSQNVIPATELLAMDGSSWPGPSARDGRTVVNVRAHAGSSVVACVAGFR